MKAIPLGTKWSDLPAATQSQLQAHADARHAAFRARWAASALAEKEAVLLGCPTAEMTAAIDDYYRKTYSIALPPTFSLGDLKNKALVRELVRLYLASHAAYRATLTYPSQKLPNRDWDGKSLFDSLRLPDRQTFNDIKRYSATVVQALKSIDDAALGDLERRVRQETLFDARALSVGAFTGDSFGGADMESACEIASLNNDVIQGYNKDGGRPKIFASDDEVLREVNAIYLHSTRLRWLDKGTWASAGHPLCAGDDEPLKQYVGDPATHEVAKGIMLLRDWWRERTASSPGAQARCTVYSEQDRAEIWEAFSADQRSNNDGSTSMVTYRARIASLRTEKAARYRDAAKLALREVFPNDAVLSAAQRQQVLSGIEAEPVFGLFIEKIAAMLDTAQGTTRGPAATAWNNAVATQVERIGADYATDEVAIKKMFEEVKAWVGSRYTGYPIDVASTFSRFKFSVNGSGGAETTTADGNIKFGIGTPRSKMEYYSILLHELRHAVGFAWRAGNPGAEADSGPAVEGSGVAVEELLLAPFLRETLKNDLAFALYSLDYAIRDARFVGTTDAALQRYFRSGCSGANDPDTVEFVKAIAASYGLTGAKADTLAQRSHMGTQYFQYVSAGAQIVDDIRYLQQQIDPGGRRPIDPFVLFACGLNTPRRDAAYVAALKACMKF